MKVTLFGSTGTTGSKVLDELLKNNHQVTAVVRFPEKVSPRKNLTVVAGDVLDYSSIENHVKGADAVVSTMAEGLEIKLQVQSKGNANIIKAMTNHNVKRIVVMGAIGILQFDETSLNNQQPWYMDIYKPVSEEHMKVWAMLKQSKLEWTIMCPPAILPQDANYKYITKVDYFPSSTMEVNAGNIGDFISKELTNGTHIHKRVGITNA